MTTHESRRRIVDELCSSGETITMVNGKVDALGEQIAAAGGARDQER